MKLTYYPGCTLKTQAKNFETSALACASALGIDLIELEKWNCCGAVHSLVTDDLIHHVAPIRVLITAQEQKTNGIVTLCNMCYNALKQAHLLLKEEPDKKARINMFMDGELDYLGEVNVYCFLEVLKNLGFESIKLRVKKPLPLKLATYYGCLLLRPKKVSIDEPENPQILENLLKITGAKVIETAHRTKCCGAYHTVNNPDIVVERAYTILTSAQEEGADAIVTTCPLCFFNLDSRQKDVYEKYSNFRFIPIFYFTQVLAIALGLGVDICCFEQHCVDPRIVLKDKIS